MNTSKSNGKSKQVIEKVVEVFVKNKSDTQKIVNYLNKPLRKLAHASIYFILAIIIIINLNLFLGNKFSIKYLYIISIILCFLYAISDEFHQTFVKGRTGQFTDVIIDTLGSIIGLLLYKKISKTIKQ